MRKVFIFFVPFLTGIQFLLLYASNFIFQYIFVPKKKVKWVVGVHEISANIINLSRILENSISVSLKVSELYDYKYDYQIRSNSKLVYYLKKFVYGPFLLGYLANKADSFFYIWDQGFLFERKFEFWFLKKKNKKLVLMFCGDDIRSPKLSLEYSNSRDLENFLNYATHDPILGEKKALKNAAIADKYADLIFNYPICQISYIKKKQYHFPYMYPKEKFSKNLNKFENLKTIKILHAPSNPLVKGTPIIRAAIKKLKFEAYDFEYVELVGVSNLEVLDYLNESHIVLNSFYGLGTTLGLFAIEAMAHYNCLLTSYDEASIHEVPFLKELGEACVNTKYWEIYDQLKFLLENPDQIQQIAKKGYSYTYNNFEYSNAKKYFDSVLV